MNKEFNPVLVAVYGTLKRGFYNHGVMGESEFLGEIKTEPSFTLYDVHGMYPALVNEGNTKVSCEIFKVTSPETLKRIYRLEGYSGTRGAHNTFYNTMDIPTPWGDAEVFIQTLEQNKERRVIESGIFQ